MDKKNTSIAVVLIAVFLVVGFLFKDNFKTKENSFPGDLSKAQASTNIPSGYVRRVTDGVYIDPADQPSQLYGVMIENSSDAWPLTGLAQARMVIEAPVEGNIPRFLAFYDNAQDVQAIGPVRSARPYYVDWVLGFQALYAHVGGSPQALQQISSSVDYFRDVNEFFWAKFFWRDKSRYAPHNVYTSSQLLAQAFAEREFVNHELTSFTYADEVIGSQIVEQVAIRFSPNSDQYQASWVYDSDKQTYIRYQGGQQQFDADGTFIQASNVIILETDIWTIDAEGRKAITTAGGGNAYLYQAGLRQDILWQKQDKSAVLQFLQADNISVPLLAGSTWIEVVHNMNNVQEGQN